MKIKHDNRSAFVTGGSTGIGAAIVRALVRDGYGVGFLDINVQAGRLLESELNGNAYFF